MTVEGPSTFTVLLRGLLDDLGRLWRGELELARLELEDKLHQLLGGIWMLGGGMVFAIVALVLAAQALVEALTQTMEPWLANLVVAGGALLLCLIFLLAARRALAARNLKPTRTLRSLSKDADAIQEAIE
ncbi:MAG: phage holin family protein [Tistlia sp.]|uniref:phage holin family protein n=1 Tax=Tistlia sp. TaxID=3057121 RepID=UPI0034A2263A